MPQDDLNAYQPPGPDEPGPPPAVPTGPPPQRSGCLTAFLVLVMIANPLTALAYFFAGSTIKQAFPDAPAWAIPLLGVMCLANLAFAIALWKWKKWGFYGFAASAGLALVVNLMIGVPIHQTLAGPVGVVILYFLLRPVWDQLA